MYETLHEKGFLTGNSRRLWLKEHGILQKWATCPHYITDYPLRGEINIAHRLTVIVAMQIKQLPSHKGQSSLSLRHDRTSHIGVTEVKFTMSSTFNLFLSTFCAKMSQSQPSSSFVHIIQLVSGFLDPLMYIF